MKQRFVFHISLIIFICGISQLTFAGSPYNSASSSFTRRSWSSASTWASSNTPPTTGFTANDVINISYGSPYQSIKLSGTLNFQAGSNVSLTIAAGDTLIVDALTVTSGCNFTINGVLIVTGNFSNSGGITVGNAIVVLGNTTNSGSLNNGAVYTFGTTSGNAPSNGWKTQANFNATYGSGTSMYQSIYSSTSWLISTFTWDGGGANDSWQTAANWDQDIAPSGNVSENLVFAGSTRTTPNNNYTAGTTFASISFSNGASSFTLSGNAFTLTGASAVSANNASNTMTISNNITFSNAAPTISSTSGGTLTISGIIAGTTGLTKSGTGTININGEDGTLTGALTINAGTIDRSSGVAQPFDNVTSVIINNGGTLKTSSNGGHNMLFGSTNSIPITINSGGTLQCDIYAHNILGTLTLNGGTLAGSNPDATYGTWLVRDIDVTGNNTSTISALDLNLNLAGGVTFDVANGTQDIDLLVSGTITNKGTNALIKAGAGKMKLSGVNTYSGATTINAGAFHVTGSVTATSAVTVASGATLSGNGTVSRPITINNGGIIEPGDGSTGTLNTGNLTLNNTSVLTYELGATGSSDKIAVTGTLTLDGTINITDVTGFGAGTYTILTATSTITNNTLTVGTAPAGYSYSVQISGANVNLVVVVTCNEPNPTWDISSAAGYTGGAGTWGSDAYWSNDGSNLCTWPGSGNSATFAGSDGTYAITVSGTQNLTDLNFDNSGYTLSGGTLNFSSGVVTVASGKTATIASTLAGTSGLTKNGTGTLNVTGEDGTLTGTLTVNAGTIDKSSSASVPFDNITSVIINNGGTLKTTSNGGHNMLFGSTNSIPITINSGGTLQCDIYAHNILGTLTLNGGTLAGSNPDATYGTWLVRDIDVTGNNTSTISALDLNLNLAGGVTFDVANGTQDIDLLVSGTITNKGGNALIKAGAGKMKLSGVNTYPGATTINAGTFHVTGSVTATSSVTVASSATLSGNGTVSRPITINNGGIIEPGDGTTGTLNTGNLTLNNTSVLTYELGATGSSDKIAVTGTLTLDGTINITNVTGFGVGTYTILTATSTITNNTLTVGTSPAGYNYSVQISGANVNLIVTSVTDFTWDGGGSDDNWATAANWVGDVAPVGNNSENLTFAGSTRTTPSNNYAAGTTFRSINFSNGASSFTLSGNAFTLTGGASAITASNASNTMAINNNITFSTAAPTITSTSGGTLTIGGTIDNGGYLITNSTGGTQTFSGIISGSGGFTKSGSGTITFSAVNSYSGATTISAGTLKLGAAGVIADANAVTVTGTLDMNTYSETVGSIAGAGTIDNVSGAGTPTLTCGGDNTNTTFSGVIQNTSGSLTLTKTGTGILTLSGNNTFNGGSNLNGGKIHASHNNAFGTNTITLNTGSNLINLLSGINIANNIIINSNVNPGGGTGAIYAMTGNTLSGTITINGSTSSGGHFTSGTGANKLTITGAINSAVGVVLRLGDYLVSGGGSYSSLYVGNGTLYLGAHNGLSTTANLIVFRTWGNTTFDLNGYNQTLEGLSETGAGNTITVTNNGASNSTLTINNTADYSFSGNIVDGSRTITLVKNGNGIYTISGSNTYTGTTTINAGILKLGSTSALGTNAAGTIVSSGAALDLNGITYSTTEALSVAGTGYSSSGVIYNSNASTATYAGALTLTAASTITANNNITLSGTITNGGFLVTVTGTATTTCSGVMSGTGGITINTALDNVTILSGNNNFSGTVTITTGGIRITNSNGLGTGPKTIFMNNGTIGEPSLRLDGSGGDISLASNLSFTVSTCSGNNGGVINEAGNNTIAGVITNISGGGGTRFRVDAGTLTLSGNYLLGATNRGPIFDGSGNGFFTGILSDNGYSPGAFITKNGTGTWTISGANTYTGATLVNAGILKINNTAALGTNATGTTVASGATIDLNGLTYATTEALSIAGTGVSGGGAVINTGGSASFAGDVTLTADATITANNQITLSGTISPSTYSLTKAGTNSLVFTNNTITINNFTISAGTVVGGSSTINIYGSFTCAGTFTANTNTVNFTGSSAQIIPALTFYNVNANNSAGTSLAGNITIGGTITMLSGILTTGAFTVDLSSAGSIVEATPSATAPTSYVIGNVKATRALMQNVNNTFGGIGVELLETNLNNNSTEVIRVTGSPCTGLNGNQGISRYFTINPVTDVGLNGTMKFYYFDNEISGHTEANLDIYKSTDGRVTWSKVSPTRNAASNLLTATGITSFSDWTASDGTSEPLPISLVEFDATLVEQGVEITWSTASEKNNDYFTVERSVDGINWVWLAILKGAGNSTSLISYDAIDYEMPIDITYYRLKQTDFDGTSTYSKIVSVENSTITQSKNVIFYKKSNKSIQLILDKVSQANTNFIEIISIHGQVVLQLPNFVSRIDSANIPKGVYYVYVQHGKTFTAQKIVIN